MKMNLYLINIFINKEYARIKYGKEVKMKRCTQKMFAAIDSRNMFSQIGRMGEIIAESLLLGERVSSDEVYPSADVVNIEEGVVCEVKMCNGRHAIRILPNQINRLGEQVQDGGFVFGTGIYVLIFYRGIDRSRGGKSLLFSRKNSGDKRREIIADELQYIYVVDVPLLVHITKNYPDFYRLGCIVSSQGKTGREGAVYLNRTTLAGFRDKQGPFKKILNEKYGPHGWTTGSTQVEFGFTKGDSIIKRDLPVHYIGSRKTARVVKERISSIHPNIQLTFDNVLL
ncbi:hypothetical protein EB001_06385 [bacterium]|nr:hypothetical protein [bacterium]